MADQQGPIIDPNSDLGRELGLAPNIPVPIDQQPHSDFPLPRTWAEAWPILLWGMLALALVFVFAESVGEIIVNPAYRAGAALVSVIGVTAMLIYRQSLLAKFRDPKPSWIVAAICTLLWVLASSPFIEEKRWPFSAWFDSTQAAQSDGDVVAMADYKSLGDKLETVTNERNDLRKRMEKADENLAILTQEVKDTKNSVINDGNATQQRLDNLQKDVDSLIQQRDQLKQQLAAAQEKLQTQQSVSIPADQVPITWQDFVGIYGNQSAITYMLFRGINVSSSEVQLKSAYIYSDLTGEKLPLLVNIPYGGLDGEKLTVDQVNPIAPAAKVQLEAQWIPGLPVLDFYNKWGKSHIEIDYGKTQYTRSFDENTIRGMLIRDIVGADLVLGIPRVTKKSDPK